MRLEYECVAARGMLWERLEELYWTDGPRLVLSSVLERWVQLEQFSLPANSGEPEASLYERASSCSLYSLAANHFKSAQWDSLLHMTGLQGSWGTCTEAKLGGLILQRAVLCCGESRIDIEELVHQ